MSDDAKLPPESAEEEANSSGTAQAPIPEGWEDDDEESSAFDTHMGEAIDEHVHIPPVPETPLLKALHTLYFDILNKLETGIIIACLAGVVLLPLIEIINRNLGANFWDGTLATRISYMLTFYVGLFGGVYATRYARHIAIDVVAPYLKPKVRQKLTGVLFLICAAASVWLTWTSYRFVYTVLGAEDRMFPDVVAWWGNERLWKLPIIFAFVLLTAHFAIEGVRRLMGKQITHGHGPEKKKKKKKKKAKEADPVLVEPAKAKGAS